MRIGAAVWVLLLLLSSSLTAPGGVGANDAGSGTDGRDGWRGTTLIYNVSDLQNMSLDLNGSYELANDIDASGTKSWNGGAGFAPVGNQAAPFNGTLDGKGCNITGVFISRSGTDYAGLFGYVKNGSVNNLGLVNSSVVGRSYSGGLIGYNYCGTVNNSYVRGNLSGGGFCHGGLVGYNYHGTVNNSYANGSVTGTSDYIGGLVGYNDYGTVNGSYASGAVNGRYYIGGLVGANAYGAVNNSYFSGIVNGTNNLGGLEGYNREGTISNSHYNIDKVLIKGGHHITLGGIFDAQYQDWFSDGLSLNISECGTVLVPSGEYYDLGSIQGLRDLLGFADVRGYKFRLAADIDLSGAPGLYIPYLAADFDGANHTISKLRINLSFVSYIGMFGYNKDGTISNTNVVESDVTGNEYVSVLVGNNGVTVNNSHAAGNVTGTGDNVGGLAGRNNGTVNNSHATVRVTGAGDYVGGLLGYNGGTASNTYASVDLTGAGDYVGGLVGKSDGTVNNSYALGNVTGGSDCIGGLVGYNAGTVNNSYARVNIIGGGNFVGGLVGANYYGTVNNSYATWNVTTDGFDGASIGGLVGVNNQGMVNNSCARGNLTIRGDHVGGLVGYNNYGTVNGSYASGIVKGWNHVGGLVGSNFYSAVNNSYFSGTVNGTNNVGGLEGYNREGTISNSHYNIDEVLIKGGYHITIGGIFDAQYQDWFSNGLSLNISDYGTVLVPSGEYYDMGSIQGLRDLLGFADVGGYKFRLAADIDLSGAPGLYIPYLAADFDGANHTISNLRINMSYVSCIGMFGYSKDGTIKNTNVVECDVTGNEYVGGLVGNNGGTVNNSHAAGNMTGTVDYIGGLAGRNNGTVNNSHATGNVTGTGEYIGGLLGYNGGMANNSYASVNVTGIGDYVGGLVGDNGGTVNNSNACGNVNGIEYVGGLAGMNIGTANNSYASVNVTGTDNYVGGLVGYNYWGTVSNSYAIGRVNGTEYYNGGLVGYNRGTVNNTYAAGKVNGMTDVGGLVGYNDGTVNNSYASGNVTGTGFYVGGLVGYNNGNVFNCFWDKETSGRNSSQGGTGKTTGEMKTRSTFTSAGWNLTSIWCMIENVTYPFLRWHDTESPAANAGLDRTIDEDVLFTFNGSGSYDNLGIADYVWTFSDGVPVKLFGVQPKHQFNTPGIYVVTLNVTDAVGHWDTDSLTVTVNDITLPVAEAGLDRIIEKGTLVTFNGSGSFDNVGVVNYTWTFIDGVVVTLYGVQPQYQFNFYGLFNVTLKVTDAAGHNDTDTMTITVRDITPPSADAGPDQNVDEDILVTFNGSGSSDNVGIVNYSWNFTDGTQVALYGVNPTYMFNRPGIFVVMLNVTDAAGFCDADTMIVTVKDITAPVADAGPNQTIDEGTMVTFDGNDSSDNVGIVNYTWTFTDVIPVVLYGVLPTYQFDNPGVFIVTLNVTDAAGNWSTDTMTVTVNDITAPVADAGPDQAIDEGTMVTFDGNDSSDNVGIVNYTWTFTDETPVRLHGVQPTYKFDNPGILVVMLNVTDASGNWDMSTMNVTVNDITVPFAEAGPDQTLDEGTLVTFNGSGCSDNLEIVNYSWSFSDGAPIMLYGVNPSYKFDNPGVFVVTLNVTDAAGNWGTDTTTIIVKDITPPKADAGQDQTVSAGNTIVLNGSLSTDNVGIGKYAWNFTYYGKTKSLEGKTVSFVFDKGGVYEVVLTVNDLSGNPDDDKVVITVVDTGMVTGTVLDGNKKPVEGATVEITASNGMTCTTKTAANGTFSIEVHHGPFTWTISKGGYRKISGNSSVNPMDEGQLDLSDHPLRKQENKGPSVLPMMPILVIILIVAAAVGIGVYAVMRKKRAQKVAQSTSSDKPAPEEEKTPPGGPP